MESIGSSGRSYESESGSSSSSNGIVLANQKKPFNGIRLENPFSFKVLQVFTGFGFGCGVGIGVGQPLQLGALPMVGEVMRSARGATSAFSGVTWQVNSALSRLGAKNVKAGIGCGVGFGHGFGVGLAVKPGVLQNIQTCVVQLMGKAMSKLGIAPNLSIGQVANPISLQSGMNMMNQPSIQNPLGSFTQMGSKFPDQTLQGPHGHINTGLHSNFESSPSNERLSDSSYTRTEKVLSSFLQSPVLNGDDNLNQADGRLQSENNVLQMLLKHQQVIEELVEENEKLRQVMLEDLKVSPSKLEANYSGRNRSPCSDCFECRRRQRKRY